MAQTGTLLVGTSFIFLYVQVALGTPTTLPSVEIDIDGPGHEGNDILYTPEQQALLDSRKALNSLTSRWTEVNGIPNVPFRFADSIVSQTLVRSAIAHWVEHTCLVFPEVADDYASDHIYFQRHASSCNSNLGMVGNGGQPINVPEWCEKSFGSLVHEIGHAIGFFHEQSRSDRDTYVNINEDNRNPSATVNFLLANDNNHSVPYDYNSDMHYSERAFSINGKITIATHNPLYQGVIGQRTGLSHMDKLLANKMYSCIDKNLVTCSLASDPCQNYGYLGKDCNCVCPQGTSGTNCETLATPYNDVNLSLFTETVTTETTITSPNYPGITPGGEKYTKWIQAPECKLVKLNFSDFSLDIRRDSQGMSICKYDGLEIRTDNMFDGTWYCGTEISTGQEITSTGNQMIVYFLTRYQPLSNAKWSADVTFVDDPSCSMSNTSTSSSTTTEIPVPECPNKEVNGGKTQVTSPNYPNSYPINAMCKYENLQDIPKSTILTFNKFKLSMGASLSIEHPYGPSFVLMGSRRRRFSMKVPSEFRATFTSDDQSTNKGFLMYILEIKSQCHESLDATTPGVVTTPNYPGKHRKKVTCEWKITASPGMRVRVTIAIKMVKCGKNYVSVNTSPMMTPFYDPAMVETFCGKKKKEVVTSQSNVISVFYWGEKKDRGFRLSYEEIP